MTPKLAMFKDLLAEIHGPLPEFRYVEGPLPAMIIPARHPLVGDLNIYDDGDEWTVEIGTKYHSHFAPYYYDRYPEDQRLRLAAGGAAQFVDDVLRDRVCLRVDYIGDQCISASCFNGESGNQSLVGLLGLGESAGVNRSEYFRWSGPIS